MSVFLITRTKFADVTHPHPSPMVIPSSNKLLIPLDKHTVEYYAYCIIRLCIYGIRQMSI